MPSRRWVRPWAVCALPLRLFYPGTAPQDCRRCCSVRSRHHVSTFLHPFAPPALPGFSATMRALTPARGCACGLLNLAHSPARCRAGLSTSRAAPSGLSVSNHPTAPPIALSPVLSASGASRSSRVWASPFHRRLASRHGRIEFVSYGLPVRLALLPTPPRDDAVTVGYRTETGIPEGDLHLSDVTRLWTHDGRVKPGHDVCVASVMHRRQGARYKWARRSKGLPNDPRQQRHRPFWPAIIQGTRRCRRPVILQCK